VVAESQNLKSKIDDKYCTGSTKHPPSGEIIAAIPDALYGAAIGQSTASSLSAYDDAEAIVKKSL
jgi:outer membrane lipoprotein SlyB